MSLRIHNIDYRFIDVAGRLDHKVPTTHLWPPPVCPGVSPVRWWGGGRSICRLQSLWLSGCLATGPESWRTLLTWAADYSGQGCGNVRPLCHSPVAMTTRYTGTYWPHRWDGGLHPLLVPPSDSHWSLLGRLRGTEKRWKDGLMGKKIWTKYKPSLISCLMNKTSQFLNMRMWILSGALNQESWFDRSSIFVTFDDNVEWLLWVKAASGIQWKGFLFTLAIWNFPWKRLESFLMADSVYLSQTPQGLPK